MDPLVDKNGLKYFKDLPPSYKQCEDFRELFKLINEETEFIKDNIVPIVDKVILIYSPYSNLFWYRKTYSGTNYNELLKYFKDKNLYLEE